MSSEKDSKKCLLIVPGWSGPGNVDLARQVMAFLDLHSREDVIIIAESPVAKELKRFAASLDRGELLPDHVVRSQNGAPLEPEEFLNACFDLVPFKESKLQCFIAAQNVQQTYLWGSFVRMTGRTPEFLSTAMVRSDPEAKEWYMRGVTYYVIHASLSFIHS